VARNFVIIGAGEAGVAAAAAIRAQDADATIQIVTDEPHLPYERPPLSKDVLTGEGKPTLLRQPEWYESQRVNLVQGVADRIDSASHTIWVADKPLSYDKLLIATGAHARRLPFPGILYLRRWEDAMAIRDGLRTARRIAVVGGGVIGLELASSARALGLKVVVIEAAERLMSRALAPEVSEWLYQLHRGAGVNLLLGKSLQSVDQDGDTYVVTLATGERFEVDLVLAGVGAVPEIALASSAGCAIDNGVLVDASGRTSVDDIYAAGDGAHFFLPSANAHVRLEAWQHAGRHGAHVGQVMAGGDQQYDCTPWFWTDQFKVNLQVAGFAAQSDQSIWRGTGAKRLAFHFKDDRLVGATAIDNGRDMRSAIQLIEAGWTGDAAILADEDTPLRTIAQAARIAA
jgi:3-phenylpropionate/trans-cinnamate dioxygenase ferredoxin reductase subunit